MWDAVGWLQPLVTLGALALALAALRRRWVRAAAGVQAGIVAASTVALAFYVASEDDYRRGGISRWEAYDAEEVTIAALASGTAAAILLLVAAVRDRHGLGGLASLLSVAAAGLTFVAFFANSLN